ncbi:hypothetical protein [Amycolatopsis sp. NPDC051371]|uniref:hypothetical protein n=1 Tax=Amycolatopsis sp. NPDC051371 TaxID=3155800 RepID=UPI0034277F48
MPVIAETSVSVKNPRPVRRFGGPGRLELLGGPAEQVERELFVALLGVGPRLVRAEDARGQ